MDEYKKVKENIDIYRGILNNKKKLGENVDYIEKMIEKLLAKEIWLEHRIKLLMEKNKNNELNINIDINNMNNNTNRNIRGDNYSKILGNTSSISDIDKTLSKSKKFNIEINDQNSKISNESNINIFNSVNVNDKNNTLLSSNTNLTSLKSSPNIINAIKEIFIHYSQLHIDVNPNRLFSYLEEKKLHLDLHEFSKFCSDFNIPIKRQKLVEIFKKTVANLQYMTFKEFNCALTSLGNATHESKKNKLNENIKHKKFELNSIILKEKQMKEEKKLKRLFYNSINSNIQTNREGKKNSKSRSPSGYGYRLDLKLEKKNVFNEIADNKIKYNKENKKSYQEIMKDFYAFLGLYNKQEYRSKMRNYNMYPITLGESTIRKRNKDISLDDKTINRSKSFIELEKINIMKSEKLKKELMEEEKMKNKLYKEKLKLFDINNKRLKITVDRKSKKKTYLELMKEKNEEKTEIISMHKQQKDMLLNKLKEKELKRIKEKERERKMKQFINNTNSKEDSKEQFQLNELSEIKKEKEEEYEKRYDKNQIWWSKLENYNIEDLGMNDAEKELFISSDLTTDEKNNLENNSNEITNQNNNENNSLGQFINDNSLLKSNSKVEIENNNNKEKINKIAKPIQLPPINSSRVIAKKEKEVHNKNKPDIIIQTNPNSKIKTINVIKSKNKKI